MSETESGAQQYCLRWNNHSESIVSEFEILLDQEDFVDVTLSCDKQSLKAHKVVLSACSTYFRKLLKENPCQHPIIILRDVGFPELAAILHFMYHGQVMVEQERIPQLLQTAQMLEVRGLCEVRDGQESGNSSTQDDREAENSRAKGNNSSFLAGLLGQTSVSATKRTISASNQNMCNNSNSNSSPPASKRQRSSSRPVPMLQSILSQQLAVPATPMFDLTKNMGSSSARALTALASKVQGSSSNAVSTSTGALLPTSLENLLGGLPSTSSGHAGDRGEINCGSHCSTTSFQDEDTSDRDASKVESSSCGEPSENRDSGHEGAAELEPDTVVQIKEEPPLDFDDEFCDDSDTRGGATGDEDGQSESENELGLHGEGNGRGEASLLPLLAQHLAAPSLLSASAKLRAAASQARTLHSSNATASVDSPLIAQALLAQPSTPPDMGPSSMGTSSDAASPSGEPPRKLAFHEPRPCPICRRMYRDAATLRTHTAIMHAEGRDPFACLCGELFRTKYEMYTHKKNGHR